MQEPPKFFDICIVCALYEEASAVIDEFSTRCGVTFMKAFRRLNQLEYRHAMIQNRRGESLTVFVTWLSRMGPIRTGLDLVPLLHEIRPRFVAMTGVCAGDRRQVKLGDLIVATSAYHPEEGKIITGAGGQPIRLPETQTAGATTQVIHYVQGFDEWKAPVRELKRQQIEREWKATDEPHCHIKVMASSMAVRADNPFPRWTSQYHRKTVGIDMETATFYTVLRDFPLLHGLVVKGVSDYGDSTKNDRYRDYARRASAVYLLHFIREYVTEETMPRRDALPTEEHVRPSGVWNVPYPRNPHFTGRVELLDMLDQHLSPAVQDDPTTTRRAALTQPQAIKGLGGIGKTQIAVEYAYRAREQGQYIHIFWVNAASKEAFLISFVTIAELLPAFSAKSETDQSKLVRAIIDWLEQCQERWLLVFDNVDDVPIIEEYLPQRGNGSVLFTTRAHAVGSLAASLEVETMGLVEGTQLLLSRSQHQNASDEERNEAANVVIALDCFPLALDQAGAYIEETGCGFADYLQVYQDHRKALLARRGRQTTNYPDSVATTWSLSFQKVEQANPAAAELLRLCAFLAPDKIPEEFIRHGAAHWSRSLQQAAAELYTFNQTIEELLKFSLLKRHVDTQTLSIHRLVQAVQMDTLKPAMQRHWAERVVQAANEVLPRDATDVTTWPKYLRYLEQVQACDTLIRQYKLAFTEAADLLNRAAIYLREHASYSIAEPLFQQALSIYEQQLGADHLVTAASLDNLGILYQKQGKYAQAELLYRRVLSIREQQLGADHPSTARSLTNLAIIYRNQGKYAQAEPLYQQALSIREQHLGPEHLETAQSLDNLAILYWNQGKYAQAEPFYQRALSIREQQLGADHPSTARSLNNLAILYRNQGKYEQAELLYQQALFIREQHLGLGHPDTAASLDNLASLYWNQGKYAQAEPLYQRALAIREQRLGPEHPSTARSLNNLAILYWSQGNYEQAEPLYQRALSIREQQLGNDHPETAQSLDNLAILYRDQGKYAQAEPLFQRALSIREQQLGAEHPETAASLDNLAGLYSNRGKYTQAEPLYRRALAIREQHLGPEHPDAAFSLTGLANLYREQGKYVEAEPLYQRALSIREQTLDPYHFGTAETLHGFAMLRETQGNTQQAASFYQRALTIRTQALGPAHPQTIETYEHLRALNNAIRTSDNDQKR